MFVEGLLTYKKTRCLYLNNTACNDKNDAGNTAKVIGSANEPAHGTNIVTEYLEAEKVMPYHTTAFSSPV